METPIYVHSCANIKVQACVLPALGAHVLLQFHSSVSSECFGRSVVSLTDLINVKESVSFKGADLTKSLSRSKRLSVPVVNGGKLCGTARGTFALELLAVVERPY